MHIENIFHSRRNRLAIPLCLVLLLLISIGLALAASPAPFIYDAALDDPALALFNRGILIQSGTDRLLLAKGQDATWHPIGGILYEHYEDRQSNIWLAEVGPTGQITKTSLVEYASHPAWHPNGTEFAFVSYPGRWNAANGGCYEECIYTTTITAQGIATPTLVSDYPDWWLFGDRTDPAYDPSGLLCFSVSPDYGYDPMRLGCISGIVTPTWLTNPSPWGQEQRNLAFAANGDVYYERVDTYSWPGVAEVWRVASGEMTPTAVLTVGVTPGTPYPYPRFRYHQPQSSTHGLFVQQVDMDANWGYGGAFVGLANSGVFTKLTTPAVSDSYLDQWDANPCPIENWLFPWNNREAFASAQFTISKNYAGLQHLLIYSMDSAGILPLEHHWDFGDGTDSSNEYPKKLYGQEGRTYTISYTVRGGGGLGAPSTITREVDVPETFVGFEVSTTTLRLGQSIVATSTSGIVHRHFTRVWCWWGDGTNCEEIPGYRDNVGVTHTYTATGAYSITLELRYEPLSGPSWTGISNIVRVTIEQPPTRAVYLPLVLRDY